MSSTAALRPVVTDETTSSDKLTARDLETTAKRIAHPLGLDVGKRAPIVDARLPDGSRVAIACPPITETYAFSIRRFGGKPWTTDMLIEAGSLPQEVLACSQQALDHRHNILISGGTGTGKTTMLAALASLINEEERIVCIEDTRELQIPIPNCLRLEAKGAREKDGPNVTIRDLVRHALRHRPDRLIVGEVRGDEAGDLIQALNTGHGGSISTVHANSARAALTRLATCALQSDVSFPWNVICELVALAVQLVIHLERSLDGRRSVQQVLQVHGYSQARGDFDCSLVWGESPQPSNVVAVDGKARAITDGQGSLRCALCSEPGAVRAVAGLCQGTLCKKCRRKKTEPACLRTPRHPETCL